MRRLALLSGIVGMFVLLTACGGKKARVAIPNPPAPATPNPPAPVSPSSPAAVTPNAPARVTPSATELEGLATYYAEPYHGRRTASGEVFDTYKGMTAAHRTLPFNTVVRVTNTTNGKQVVVRINDRGPFIDGRVIDLSLAAARKIDLVRPGIAPVRLQIIKQAVASGPAQSTPGYAVQVGAFENESVAEMLRRDLQGRYGDASIQPVRLEQTLYRVRVGHSSDVQTADQLAIRLRAQRFDSFVVRLD